MNTNYISIGSHEQPSFLLAGKSECFLTDITTVLTGLVRVTNK
jgi:hypothetical protein